MQQEVQQEKQERQLQQHSMPQQRQRTKHQIIDMAITAPTTMPMMTGHLGGRSESVMLKWMKRERKDVLAVCFCHTLVPAREGVFDAIHLG